MTTKYPDHQTYRELYARYYSGRDVAELLQRLEPLWGMRVLDICGGDGRLALAALEKCARDCELVDAAAPMVPNEVRKHPLITVHIDIVHVALFYMYSRGVSFDRVVCRQAVNYWLDEATAGFVANVLRPGGIFVFNTFNQKPPEKPRVLQYPLDGHEFVEVSWVVGDTVHHVQVRDGMEPHCTAFRWISPEQFRKLLEPYFEIHEEQREKTSLYRCVKK